MSLVWFFLVYFVSSTNGQDAHTTFLNVLTKNMPIANVLCMEQLESFKAALGELDEKNKWAWEMLDASSKLQNGILNGNLADFGAFDECINIETNKTLRGKYCLGDIQFKQTAEFGNFLVKQKNKRDYTILARAGVIPEGVFPGMRWAACFPSGCKGEEIAQIFNAFVNKSLNGLGGLELKFREESCQTIEQVYPELTTDAIITIAFFAVTIAFMVCSTIYDGYLRHTRTEPLHVLLLAFSVLTNGSKLFKVRPESPDQLSCLNGLRVISMMWVILGHQYSNIKNTLVVNALSILEWISSLHSMLLIGATVSVDSFFLLSGLLMTYGFLKAMTKGIPFNVPLYWLHRILRLTPPLAVIIWVSATLVPYLVNGPMWPDNYDFTGYCREYWWSTLLYIQNYVNVNEMCVGQSWYLAVDMQLFILSPLILIPLWKWRKLGLTLLCTLILISIAIPFAIVWKENLALSINDNENKKYSEKYYFPTHTRASPWLIGVLLGYLVHTIKKREKPYRWNLLFVTLMWVASLFILYICVFGGHDLMQKTEYNKFEQVCYVTLIRPAWAIALCWLVVACVTGYGGPINWILSLPAFQVLGRFTYSQYLIHPIIITISLMSKRMPTYFSDFDIMYSFWGTTIFTTAIALFWILAFESPMIVIEKVLFRENRENNKSNRDLSTKNNLEIK